MGNYGEIMGKLRIRYGVLRLRINRQFFLNQWLWVNYDSLWVIMGILLKIDMFFWVVTGKLWVFFIRIMGWLRVVMGGYGLRVNYG